jgi:hypothetical protein
MSRLEVLSSSSLLLRALSSLPSHPSTPPRNLRKNIPPIQNRLLWKRARMPIDMGDRVCEEDLAEVEKKEVMGWVVVGWRAICR